MKTESLNVNEVAGKVVGTWELLEYTTKNGDGSLSSPLGENARGIIIYTNNNYMSVQIMAANRRSFLDDDLAHATCTQYKAAASSYVAYSGTYAVDEQLMILNYHVEVSLFPNWIGKTLQRRFKLDGNLLIIEFEKPLSIYEKWQVTKLIWRKI